MAGAIDGDGDGQTVPLFVDDVAGDRWAAAYDEVRPRVLKAWAGDDRMTSPVRVPWGEIPGRAAEGADSYGRLAAWLGRRPLGRA